ncbi:SDR family oxidoreductase [Caenimonas soli]|uniref:hypothetical protein n=1 Tax=Caenimonas soli TaxID=2735555 RepID=UPI001556EDA3|nr:hypothetical protein [Caenimonas soli]NPC57880.1 hypothetical protein [Caenimonas soli]
MAQALTGQRITLDAVFINAGVARFAPMGDADEALWDGLRGERKGLVHRRSAGAIVLNGSINARIGNAVIERVRRQQGRSACVGAHAHAGGLP